MRTSFKDRPSKLATVIVDDAPMRIITLSHGSTRYYIKIFVQKPPNHSRGLARSPNHSSSNYFFLKTKATLRARGSGA